MPNEKCQGRPAALCGMQAIKFAIVLLGVVGFNSLFYFKL
jgi:hypothetical protein